MKEIVGLAGSLLWILTAQLTWAGPLVFGPQKFAIQSGKHLKEVVAFEVANPNGKHWLRVDNGEAVPIVGGEPGAIEIINLVDGGRILLNGKAVARSPDFHHRQTKAFGFTKDVTLQAVNTLEVDLRGEIGSFITLQIRKAEPNVTVSNSKGDLDGLNMGDQITLWWSRDEGAAEYVFFRSTSVKGPWQEIFRQDVITAGASGAAVDATPDARLMDLCYKVEALDAKGKVTRRYEPICVPKFMERQSQSFNRQRSPDTTGVIKTGKIQPDALKQLASLNFFALAPNPPIDELCLSDPQFTDFRSMTLDEIRAFLKEHDSFLQGQIKDVDGVEIDPAQELFNAAQASQINPQVLLGTLQKEQSAVTRPTPLPVDRLKLIMGFGTPTTIRQQVRDAAAQFRRDFDRLSESPPQPTASGWQVGVPKDTLDPLTVTPASKSVATLYSYTPWAGQAFGGRPDKGGNGLFCQVWEQFGFRPPEPLVLNPQNPTLTCPDGSVTFTASGGRPPYTWSTTKGVITPSADTKGAVLTPPKNLGGQGFVAFETLAWRSWTNKPADGCINTFGYYVRFLDCNEQVVIDWVSSHFGDSCTASSTFCNGEALFRTGCGGLVPECPLCVFGLSSVDTLNQCGIQGFICDQRTEEQIASGCRPCGLEMQGGATVTVEDSATPSASFSTTVTVQ